jgi:tRNA(Ile)-lysidine synthase
VAYCQANGLQPQHDPSNESPEYLRNRLRSALIPELETYNPQFRAVVRRAAHALEDDHALLQEFLDVHWNASLVWEDPDSVVFSAAALETLPGALRRGLMRRAVERLRPGQETGFAALERAARFLSDPRRPRRTDLAGGLGVLRDGDYVYVSAAGAELPSMQWPQMPGRGTALPVSIPGELTLPGGWRLIAAGPRSAARARGPAVYHSDPFEVRLDAAALPVSLELRARRPGDRFQPLGLHGHSQKLSDFFVNEKVPQRARDRWPLLCSGDTVIWVPGYRPAHAFRMTRASRMAIHFAVRQIQS